MNLNSKCYTPLYLLWVCYAQTNSLGAETGSGDVCNQIFQSTGFAFMKNCSWKILTQNYGKQQILTSIFYCEHCEWEKEKRETQVLELHYEPRSVTFAHPLVLEVVYLITGTAHRSPSTP